jgi:hypothetical protein
MSEVVRRTVKKKRVINEDQNGLKFVWLLSRAAAGIVGAIGIVMGAMWCVTILGIPIGLMTFHGSKGMFDYAGGKRGAKCPNCKKTNYIHVEQEVFTCRKCSERIGIEWEALNVGRSEEA